MNTKRSERNSRDGKIKYQTKREAEKITIKEGFKGGNIAWIVILCVVELLLMYSSVEINDSESLKNIYTWIGWFSSLALWPILLLLIIHDKLWLKLIRPLFIKEKDNKTNTKT